jgi:hypothetical protein
VYYVILELWLLVLFDLLVFLNCFLTWTYTSPLCSTGISSLFFCWLLCTTLSLHSLHSIWWWRHTLMVKSKRFWRKILWHHRGTTPEFALRNRGNPQVNFTIIGDPAAIWAQHLMLSVFFHISVSYRPLLHAQFPSSSLICTLCFQLSSFLAAAISISIYFFISDCSILLYLYTHFLLYHQQNYLMVMCACVFSLTY